MRKPKKAIKSERLSHDNIADLVEDYWKKNYPRNKIHKYYEYPLGEIDVLMIEQKGGLLQHHHVCEVKSRDTEAMRRRAYEQLSRYENYVKELMLPWGVTKYYARPVKNRVVLEKIKC